MRDLHVFKNVIHETLLILSKKLYFIMNYILSSVSFITSYIAFFLSVLITSAEVGGGNVFTLSVSVYLFVNRTTQEVVDELS